MKKSYSLNLLKILLCAVLLVIVAHVTLKYISVEVYKEQHGFLFELSNRFDMNDEMSMPQWLTQTLFLGLAAAAFLAMRLTRKQSGRYLWGLIGAGGLLLSLDDSATLHEFILQTLHNTFFLDTSPTIFKNAWLILLPIIAVGLLVLFVKMVQIFPRRTTMLLVAGSIVYIVGAVLVDSFANALPPRDFANQGLLSALEGGLQLLGQSIVLYAVAWHLEQYHAKQIAAAWQALRPPVK